MPNQSDSLLNEYLKLSEAAAAIIQQIENEPASERRRELLKQLKENDEGREHIARKLFPQP
ncbi:MAG: hypothetical protein WB992_12615 [Bryobacteraceae bacterium]